MHHLETRLLRALAEGAAEHDVCLTPEDVMHLRAERWPHLPELTSGDYLGDYAPETYALHATDDLYTGPE